jgi:hypothetical protein
MVVSRTVTRTETKVPSSFLQDRETTMPTPALYIGIDVAKATLEVGSCERHLFQAPNTSEGHRLVIERLRGLVVATIVIESMGIYARELVAGLAPYDRSSGACRDGGPSTADVRDCAGALHRHHHRHALE